jgi:hypothetical protein
MDADSFAVELDVVDVDEDGDCLFLDWPLTMTMTLTFTFVFTPLFGAFCGLCDSMRR